MKEMVVDSLFLLCLLVLLSAGGEERSMFGAEAPKPNDGALKYEKPTFLTGSVIDPGSKQLLFRFKRTVARSGSTLTVTRDFTYPEGKLAAREKVVYQGDDLASYELDEVQTGGSGSAIVRRTAENPARGTVEFEYQQGAGSRPKRHTESLQEGALIADMVGPFLASHWDELRRGAKVRCRFIVVPRRETVGFTFLRDSESVRQGHGVLIVKMEPTSRFVAALVDPLFFTIEQASPHRVLEYVGRTTPKIEVGGKWKDLDAVTVFDWSRAR